VLSDEKDYGYQLEEMMQVGHNNGLCVEVDEKWISVLDYYHAETMAKFEILSIKETEEPVTAEWKAVTE
jgi:hypothetical protein